MKKIILGFAILLMIVYDARIVFAESNDENEYIQKHEYVYYPVGYTFDKLNDKGEIEAIQIHIGICKHCGEYYYRDKHLFWYK